MVDLTLVGCGDDRGFRMGRLVFALLLALVFALVIWQVSRYSPVEVPETLVIYCFSAMQEAMERGVFPGFQRYWLNETGRRVELIPTFAGSGVITRRIIDRLPAEVAILSSKLDALELLQSGIIIRESGEEFPEGRVLCRTPLVIAVRAGNPLGISSFEDLRNAEVRYIHPDPVTSGGGQWALLAAYGSELRKTGDEDRAVHRGRGDRAPGRCRHRALRAARGRGEGLP